MTLQVDTSLRLPEFEYFPEPQRKSGIAIHHTVCDSVRTTMKLWRRDQTPGGSPKKVATAFVIERDGTIYQAFDPACWAWQFGLSWRDELRVPFEKRFIGIEISSEGGLMEHKGKFYAFDKVSAVTEKHPLDVLECDTPYRGYRWFDRYEPEQLTTLGLLVDDLCTRFAIPRVYPEQPYVYYGDALASFEGVIGHAMVRSDKSDPAPDPRLWQTLGDLAAVRPTAVTPSARSATPPLTSREIEALFAENARRINAMDIAAGSLVKALVMELERRRIYLRLTDPAPGAHTFGYEIVQGDRREVPRLARALGFQNVTESLLEVRHA